MFEVKVTGNSAAELAANLTAMAAALKEKSNREPYARHATLVETELGVNDDQPEKSQGPTESAPKTNPAEEPAPTITIEQLRSLAGEKIKEDHKAEVAAAFEAHGAKKLTGIDPSEYAGLKADLEAL